MFKEIRWMKWKKKMILRTDNEERMEKVNYNALKTNFQLKGISVLKEYQLVKGLQGYDGRVTLQYTPAPTSIKATPLSGSCSVQDPRCSVPKDQLGNATILPLAQLRQQMVWRVRELKIL